MPRRKQPQEVSGQSQSQAPVSVSSSDTQRLGGLVLMGTVVDRTRRMVPKDNPTTLIVDYTVDDGRGRKYFVDDYAPTDFFDVGTYISVPVYVKSYLKRNKEPAYTLNIQKEIISERGERF